MNTRPNPDPQIAELTRRIRALEQHAVATRHLLLTFVLDQMPAATTDDAFTRLCDDFFRRTASAWIDPEEDPHKTEPRRRALETLQADMHKAWTEKRWGKGRLIPITAGSGRTIATAPDGSPRREILTARHRPDSTSHSPASERNDDPAGT